MTTSSITLDRPLSWRDIAAVAEGAPLALSDAAADRIRHARALVEVIVDRGIRAYGVNTGVGALCDTVVDRPLQAELSRHIVLSHACGIGETLGPVETRAIIAAAVNNYAHGRSGLRLELVESLLALLAADCLPEVPARGSVGYLVHMAHIALVLIGAGHARLRGDRLTGAEALARIGLPVAGLQAKEGLSLVNGTPCATGLAAVTVARAERLLDWADRTGALTFEALGSQPTAFDAETLALRPSPGLLKVGERLRALLAGSERLAASDGARTQDALSLRSIPHVHGAARDVLTHVAATVDAELASVTDNPAVIGTLESPRAVSEAHAVGPALGLALDSLAVAVAEVAAMAERRLDRLVNPLVSGLPAFLAADGGTCSGFMIAQYTAVSLVNENRRLAAPASLDGGITSGLQEDHLSHATPAAVKALAIVENAERIIGIEALIAAQAHDQLPGRYRRAAGTEAAYTAIRTEVPYYADETPMADSLNRAAALIRRP